MVAGAYARRSATGAGSTRISAARISTGDRQPWDATVRRCHVKVLVCLVVVVAGLAACAGGGEEARGPVRLVVEGLGEDWATATETERECLQQRLGINPMLADELRVVHTFEDLDAVIQIRAYDALAPCLPMALGREVVRTFLDATGEPERDFTSSIGAECISRNPLAAKWLVDMRYAQRGVDLPSDEMREIVTAVYLCGRDVVVNGPLTRALDVDQAAAACAASKLETRFDLIPEVAARIFSERDDARSAALDAVVAGCGG
jgi:hypothetical protein